MGQEMSTERSSTDVTAYCPSLVYLTPLCAYVFFYIRKSSNSALYTSHP